MARIHLFCIGHVYRTNKLETPFDENTSAGKYGLEQCPLTTSMLYAITTLSTHNISLTLTIPAKYAAQLLRKQTLKRPARRMKTNATTGWAINSVTTALELPHHLTMQQSTFLAAFALDFGIQIVGWLIAVALKTDKTYDMFGSATFFSVSLLTLFLGGHASTWRNMLISLCVCTWAVRLGTFLVVRVNKVGHDSRLQPYLHKPASFLVLWLVQGVWVFVTMLPVLVLNTTATSTTALVWSDVVGPVLWATGFLMESVADWQKYQFKTNPANKGRFIDSGLWSLARYPNYAGEMLLWWGIYIACTPAFGSSLWAYASVASPLFVTYLLTSLSGIPLQEKQAQQRWGSEAAYQAYKRRTRLLLPLPTWGGEGA